MFPTVSPKDLSNGSVQRFHQTAPSVQRLYQTGLLECFHLRICSTPPLNGCIQQLCHQLYATGISGEFRPKVIHETLVQRIYPTDLSNGPITQFRSTVLPYGFLSNGSITRYIFISTEFLSQGRAWLEKLTSCYERGILLYASSAFVFRGSSLLNYQQTPVCLLGVAPTVHSLRFSEALFSLEELCTVGSDKT